MRKLSTPRGGGERVGIMAFEVAGLMSRAASLWRALGEDQVARLRGQAVRLEGVRRLVADDDAALLTLALAEMAGACRDLSRAAAGLAGRCDDPLLRRFDVLFAGLVAGGCGADPHELRYAAARKMDRKARKMQRLVAATGHLGQELDVLAELEQGAVGAPCSPDEAARRVAQQRQEVDRLRAASLWDRTFDYVVRLLARSLFTIVARIIEVFDLQPKNVTMDDDYSTASLAGARLSSWSSSFVGSTKSLVYPSDFAVDTPQRSTSAAKSGKASNGDVRQFLLSWSQRLRQLKWPPAGKHFIGCMLSGSKSPAREAWLHGDHDLPLSFSYDVSGSVVDDSGASFQHSTNTKLSTSVFESSSHDVLASAPETTLGAAALASHYANLVVFLERLLAVSPRHVCPDERDALYGMLTDRIRISLRARLKPPPPSAASKKTTDASCDPVLGAEWAGTVQGILGWLAPLAHNMVRWRSERSFEQRNVGSGTSVLLLQTLHFADREKAEAAITELIVALNYLWRYGTELDANAKLESASSQIYHD